MRYLLDTHIFISLINEEASIKNALIKEIDSSNGDVFLSIANLWEISIKINIGKLKVTRDINEMYDVIDAFGLKIISIERKHLNYLISLPTIHRDPFDRLIISQAISEDLTLLTDDGLIRTYPNLKLL